MIRKILTENFQPVSEQLIQKLGETLDLDESSNVLVMSCGTGISAITLSKWFGCKVIGIDDNENNLLLAKDLAGRYGLSDSVEFRTTSAQHIDLPDSTFNAVVSDCMLGSIQDGQDKASIVTEIYRLLKNGGMIGVSEIIIEGNLPTSLNSIISRVPTISGTLSKSGYHELFETVGFRNVHFKDQNEAVKAIFDRGKRMLSGAQLFVNLCNIDLEKSFGITLDQAREMLEVGHLEVEKGTIGYGVFFAEK
jgi:ubiquinone/menaquinone biosynthesis C-methylase UbiE